MLGDFQRLFFFCCILPCCFIVYIFIRVESGRRVAGSSATRSGRVTGQLVWPSSISAVQLTLTKTACANKVAAFIVPFMKKLASHMQLMYLVAYDSARTHWRSLQVTTRTESAFRKKVIKMLHGRFVHVGKTSIDLQILGCDLHQNAFGGRAPPGPAGGAITLPQTP